MAKNWEKTRFCLLVGFLVSLYSTLAAPALGVELRDYLIRGSVGMSAAVFKNNGNQIAGTGMAAGVTSRQAEQLMAGFRNPGKVFKEGVRLLDYQFYITRADEQIIVGQEGARRFIALKSPYFLIITFLGKYSSLVATEDLMRGLSERFVSRKAYHVEGREITADQTTVSR